MQVRQAKAIELFHESECQMMKREKETVKYPFVVHTCFVFPRTAVFSSTSPVVNFVSHEGKHKEHPENFTITDSKQIKTFLQCLQ